MEYGEAKRTIEEVQATLEALAMRLKEPEFKAVANDAARRLGLALDAMRLRDSRAPRAK